MRNPGKRIIPRTSVEKQLLLSMDAAEAKAKLTAVAQEIGHEIRVFTNSASSITANDIPSSSNEEPDDFYEFTPEDYYRIMSDKMGAQSKVLKTRKIREAELAARRARITKAVIRVLFPDSYILQIKFTPSETIQTLTELLMKVLARPDLPFYLYTTPPKERVKDTSLDFYTAGYVPGAIVYFSYDKEKALNLDDAVIQGPYLREDILSLNGLDFKDEQTSPVSSETGKTSGESSAAPPEAKPATKKTTKPKWLKL